MKSRLVDSWARKLDANVNDFFLRIISIGTYIFSCVIPLLIGKGITVSPMESTNLPYEILLVHVLPTVGGDWDF